MKIITEETIKHYSRDHKERVPVIEAVNVGVKYNLGRKRDDIQSLSYRLISRERWRYKEFWALKGLTFTGYNGDILGVIGANGAGKTTLCRVISGLLKPDTGRITVNGSVTALFSLGIGFNQQLTGRENIFLNGYMLGFSHAEMNKLLPQIISFTGLGRFIDEPLKRYSSGMRARLGFSIAAMLEPEILVLDEALSAGDLAFNEKAALKMQELVARAKMVVIVSHQTDFIEKHCNRALWIDQGTLRACGKPGEVVAAYKESVPAWQRTKSRKIKLVKTKTTISSERVITVQGVGVKFLLSKKENSPGYTGSPGKGFFWALKDLSFTVNAGEIVGIIGANGAGKTTLCRVLTGILKPDTGAVSIKGSTTALLSLGTGFNSQLSGRDNILLNGLMLGIPRKNLINMIDDIINFSELNEFIDRPVKEYSSGMRARLGFSIAAAIKPDIFIIDEALNAGDASFYEKASARIQEMLGQAKAVIIVTHRLDFVEKVCNRAIWLEEGKIMADGKPADVIEQYKSKPIIRRQDLN